MPTWRLSAPSVLLPSRTVHLRLSGIRCLTQTTFSTRSTFRSTGSGSRTCVVRRRSETRRPRSTASLAVRSSSPIPTSTASRWTKPLGDGRSQRLPARGSILRASRWIDGFRRDVESVHGRRMGDDYLDHADVNPECHRAGALFGAHLAVVNQLLPVEVPDLLLLQIGIERGQRCSLAATRRFPYLAHTGYRRVDEVAKGLEAGHGRACRREALIDAGLSSWRA